jgi:branched-chain amino acid transport system permease protein
MLKQWLSWRSALALAVLIVLATFPQYLSGYMVGVLTFAFYLGVYAMAWDLLFGYGGEINFGPSFLIGLGAYGAGLCNNLAGLPLWLSVIAGVVAAMIGGLILAGPALRLRGPYFGLVTFVAVLILGDVIVIFAGYTGGEIGLMLPDILTISSAGNYYWALGLLVLSALVLRAIAHSPLGLILEAYGQDPVATEALGYSVTKFKLFAFLVSALFSGLAGAMTVFYLGTASPGTVVVITVSVQVIIATVVGGRRTIFGAILGAIFLIVAGELLRPIGQLSDTVVAAIGLAVLIVAPSGFIGLFYLGSRRNA